MYFHPQGDAARVAPAAVAHSFPILPATSPSIELAVVIPTFNERGNVDALVARLHTVLRDRAWEAIFVDDDSPDGTADAVRRIARRDSRIRVIQRIGRRGLSSACMEGMCATAAPLVAVIDGDLQHDEALLPHMMDALAAAPDLELVVGSRFVEGGGTGEWDSDRVAKSALATRLSRRVLNADLKDPMSGFFMIRTEIVRRLTPRLSGIGFKILLDILTSARRPLHFRELPYVFRTRVEGESKLDHVVALEYLIALYDRRWGAVLPARAAMLLGVGALGIGVQMATVGLLQPLLGAVPAIVAAALLVLTLHFLLDNALAYRERRLRGVRALCGGWMRFAGLCGVGAAANVALGVALQPMGWPLAALAGAGAAALWNFLLSRKFAWGRY